MVEIPAVANPKKSNLMWEMRLRDEYLAKFHEGNVIIRNVRLGTIPGGPWVSQLEYNRQRILGVFRRYADVLIIRSDSIIIQEYALLPDPGDITKLELYAELFPRTMEFEQYKNYLVKMQLVGAIKDPVVQVLAARRDIEYILYEPAWLDDYLTTLMLRKRRAAATD